MEKIEKMPTYPTLLDMFAMQVMNACFEIEYLDYSKPNYKRASKRAYQQALAMLSERKELSLAGSL